MAIGGNVIGGAVVTGDHNVTDVRYRKVTLPPAESVDIRAELAALRDLLGGLNTGDRQKIANALAEAAADAAQPQADKDEIGGALERALRYAGKAAGFAEVAGKIARTCRTPSPGSARTGASCCRWSASPCKGAGDGRAHCDDRPGCAGQCDRHRQQQPDVRLLRHGAGPGRPGRSPAERPPAAGRCAGGGAAAGADVGHRVRRRRPDAVADHRPSGHRRSGHAPGTDTVAGGCGVRTALDAFARLARTPAEKAEDAARLQAAAHRLGDALAGALSADEAVFLVAAARGDPPPPLLVIESDDDRVLALPWELIRLDDRFAVRDGRLDVARSVPVSAAPVLSPPAAELSLLVNVSAPERSGLDYERESYLIVRALHEHLGVVVNEMGEVDDLVDGLRGEPTPLGVHFSGSRRARHAAVRGRLRRGSHGRGGRADHGDPPARPRAPAPFLLSPAAAAAAPVDVDGGHRPAATGDQTSGWSQNLV